MLNLAIWQGEGMRSAEMLVWMGDFNYRIELDYDTVVHLVRNFRKGDRAALANLLQEVRTLAPYSVITSVCSKHDLRPQA